MDDDHCEHTFVTILSHLHCLGLEHNDYWSRLNASGCVSGLEHNDYRLGLERNDYFFCLYVRTKAAFWINL